jgi:hypothetical protein
MLLLRNYLKILVPTLFKMKSLPEQQLILRCLLRRLVWGTFCSGSWYALRDL